MRSVVGLIAGCCFYGAVQAGVDVWTPIGPEGAQLSTVVTDPSSSTRLYATAGLDLYRSNDSGASWTRVTPPQSPIPTDCGISLPVVQGNGAVYVSTCNGLFSSSDLGISWARIDLRYANLAGDPTNPLVLYAIQSDRLWKTTDGWKTAAEIQSNLPGDNILQLVVDAMLPSRLYLLANDGVFRSLDGGVTWSPINTGLPGTSFNSLAQWGSTLFVGTEGFGVYKTDNGGSSWTPANNGIATTSITIVRVGSGPTPILYAAAPNGTDQTSTIPPPVPFFRFYRSIDGGTSWLPTGTLDTLVGDFVVSRQSDSVLYAATLMGLATSSDSGASWTFGQNNGLANAAVYALYADPVITSVLYAGFAPVSRGLKSTDRGAHWSPFTLVYGSPLQPIGVSASHGGTVYGEFCGTSPNLGCDIYRSDDFGIDWTLLMQVQPSPYSVLEAPNVPGLLFAIGGGSVLRSDDNGVTWKEASNGLPAGPTAFAIDPTNSNVLYAGAGNRIYKTTNGGGLWVNASGGLPESNVNALTVSPANPNTIFAGLGNYQTTPGLYGLYRSDDGGTTWGPRNSAFVNLRVTALAIDPNNPSNVYAGTGSMFSGAPGGGLYRSTDGGITFTPINNGLNNPISLAVNAVVVDPADGSNLYIGTNSGAFALTIDQYDSFVPVIEFYNYNLDHYFMASETQADIPALDSGAFGGWIRTGQTFKAYPQAPQAASRVAFKASLQAAGAAQPVCRFYIPPQHGDSHFYSASVAECAAVLAASIDPANPAYPLYSGYLYETPDSFYVDIPTNGSCPPGEAPVYRLWNQRFDSNHRYTTDPAIRDAMIARGYVLEGAVMCALP